MIFKIKIVLAIASLTVSYCSFAEITPDQFEDVSVIPEALNNAPQHKKVSPRGLSFPLESWGSAWGDFDGDHFPEMWTGNHRKYASLYRNNRDGTFTDLLLPQKDGDPTTQSDVLQGYVQPKDVTSLTKTSNAADSHGVAWGDFDGDGDLDLIEQSGGTADNNQSANQFFINENGKLINVTHLADFNRLRYPQGRGRSVLWFDYDNDSRLDLVLTGYSKAANGISTLFRNSPTNGFVEKPGKGFDCPLNSNFAALADLNGDEKLDLLCHHRKYPQKIFDTTNLTQGGKFRDITDELFVDLADRPVNGWDAIIADFDGDLENEIVSVSIPGNKRGATKVSTNTIYARLAAGEHDTIEINGQEKPLENGIDFSATGQLSISLTSGHLEDIYLGANATSQNLVNEGIIEWDATLNPANINHQGLPAVFNNAGLYIGYVIDTVNPANSHWSMRIRHGGPGTGVVESIWVTLKSISNNGGAASIGEPTLVNFEIERFGLAFLNKNQNRKFVNNAKRVNLDESVSCGSITAGDFDNDMDLDIYLVCEETPTNIENILYENLGDANGDGFPRFKAVANSAGAAGTLEGDGKVVAMADYDIDGFLDLFVTNGNTGGSIPNGPDQLFRNRGNTNNWIELDLVGTASNKSGIGARIEATAGGIAQVREMNGGAHNYVQDHQRIHFGLAKKLKVNLVIKWPSGIVDRYNNVSANKLYKAVEGTRIRPVKLQAPAPLVVGQDECGFPNLDKGVNHGLFIWKSCTGTSRWHVRATGGGIQSIKQFKGNVSTDQAIVDLALLSIEADDVVATPTAKQLDFEFNVTTSFQDGIDFSLPPGTNTACIDIPGQDQTQVLLGSRQKSIKLPFDLATLSACLPQPGDECGNPVNFNPNQRGINIWKNCFNGQWTIRANPGGSITTVDYSGRVTSDQVLSDVNQLSFETNDTLTGINSTQLNFGMKVKNDNSDSIQFTINGREACIDIPHLPAGSVVQLGETKLPVTLPFSTSTLAPCVP